MWQTETRQTLKHQSRQNTPLETRNRFAPLQNAQQDEVLDKKAKNYKEKETLQHRHQTPVYSKQNHQRNPVINHFPESDNPFWEQRTVPGNSKYIDAVPNGKKTFLVGTSMKKGIRIKEVNNQLRNSFPILSNNKTWSNNKTFEVLCCPYPNRRNPPTELFCVEDVMMSITKIQLQKRFQMK